MLQMLAVSLFMLLAMTQVKADEQRAVQSFELTLKGPVDKVFPLFTPEGENLWIPHWKYVAIYPLDGKTVRDMVFRTDDQTLWTLAVYEPPKRSVYVHTSPDLLVRIEVECRPIDAGHTVMKITWVFTSITEKGRQEIQRQSHDVDVQKKTESWKKWLDDYAAKAGWPD